MKIKLPSGGRALEDNKSCFRRVSVPQRLDYCKLDSTEVSDMSHHAKCGIKVLYGPTLSGTPGHHGGSLTDEGLRLSFRAVTKPPSLVSSLIGSSG